MTTDTSHDIAKIPRFYGLSTATKPENTMVGSTFLETDTQKQFVYTGDVWVREETTVVEQVGPVIVKEVLPTDNLLTQILVELKINNAHLASIGHGELTEEDIEDDDN